MTKNKELQKLWNKKEKYWNLYCKYHNKWKKLVKELNYNEGWKCEEVKE